MLSLLLRITSGFFWCGAMLIGFYSGAPSTRWFMVSSFAFVALLCQVAGTATKRFRNWKRDTGIVLLSAAGVTAGMAFAIACIVMDPEVRKTMPVHSLDAFSDYMTGGGLIAGLAALGWLHLRWEPRTGSSAP